MLQDYSLNMEEAKDLTRQFHPQMIFIESGGDNLAANFSRELADYIIYVIDVAGRFFSTSWSTIALCDKMGWCWPCIEWGNVFIRNHG